MVRLQANANKIISDLLEYSGEIQLQLVEGNPRSITEQALASVRVPNNVRVSNLTYLHPKVEVDIEKMRRVFVNLIRNAIDAMREGGDLTIRSQETNGSVQIVFSDAGAGIPEDAMRKLWTPFFTTKAKGVGLGLSISKRTVEAHKGHISVKSKVSQGSTFTVSLPIKVTPKGHERA